MQTTFNHQLEAQHLQPIHHTLSPEDGAQAEYPIRLNNHQLSEPNGNIPPAEAGARCYAMPEQLAMAA